MSYCQRFDLRLLEYTNSFQTRDAHLGTRACPLVCFSLLDNEKANDSSLCKDIKRTYKMCYVKYKASIVNSLYLLFEVNRTAFKTSDAHLGTRACPLKMSHALQCPI